MNRRTFITQAVAATAVTSSSAAATAPQPVIDTHLYLGRHPFRESISASPVPLGEKLAARNVSEAWAGSFEALLQRDVTAVNARLVAQCAQHRLFRPIGTLHPKLPDWRTDLRLCAEQHGMKAIRLHPNYHGYTLDDPALAELLQAATEQKLLVQIVAQMEDQRTQHPLVTVKPVDFTPLPALLKQYPDARVMVLNANRAMSMTALAGARVWLDIAMLEGVGGIENLLKDWPADRLVFGSHAPFFYWESARLKLQESDLSPAQFKALVHQNPIAAILS